MRRNGFMLGIMLGLTVLSATTGGNPLERESPVAALPEMDPVAKVADLKDQLEKGLKIRRPDEFAFIGHIVAMVEANELPVKLVLETFQWARRQDAHYPYPYFQRAIRIRAARIGITIN